MVSAIFLILVYLVAIILPIILVTFYIGHSHHTFLAEVGRNLALAGFMIIVAQVVLAARIKWIERAFGLDMMLRFHKYMAITAVVMLLFHPVFLTFGKDSLNLLTSIDHPWYVTLGKVAMALLLINVAVSLFQSRLRLKFENWRMAHDMLGPVIVVLILVHAFYTGHDLQDPYMRALFGFLMIVSLLLFFWHRIFRPLYLKKRVWHVISVEAESSDVWTLKLAPPLNDAVFDYLPGQFQFITLLRGRGLSAEEHHWTISSSPAEKTYVSSTIKFLGDFTATIKDTRPGDAAAVHAPFGRFSYTLVGQESDLVFIAGGIGITPLMSMLRHMRDIGDMRSVILFYGNPEAENVVFKRELEEIEAGQAPALKVVHVLSSPDETWQGEKGVIDIERIKKYCGEDLFGKTFFVCGPLLLINSVVDGLMGLGVSHRQIRTEIFTLID